MDNAKTQQRYAQNAWNNYRTQLRYDGFGMTDDEEIALIGKIDRTGKVVVPFTYR